MLNVVTAMESIDFRRSHGQPTILLESCLKTVGFLVGEFAVFLSPLGKKRLQLTHFVRALFRDKHSKRFDAHRLAFGQQGSPIEDNYPILDVADVPSRG
jgi:hypothetical protein